MTINRFTAIIGGLLLAMGVAGFIPGLLQPLQSGDPVLAVEQSQGRLFGLFPTNVVHNLLRIVLGIWALAAAQQVGSAVRFCRGASILYAVMLVAGLIPGLNTLFGLVPLYGHNVWLSALLSIGFGYYAYRMVPGVTGHGRGSTRPHPGV